MSWFAWGVLSHSFTDVFAVLRATEKLNSCVDAHIARGWGGGEENGQDRRATWDSALNSKGKGLREGGRVEKAR